MVIIPWLDIFVISTFTVVMLRAYKEQGCGINWFTWILIPNTFSSVLCQRFVAKSAASSHVDGGLFKRFCWWYITVLIHDDVTRRWFIFVSFKHGRVQWVIVLFLSCRVLFRFIQFLCWVVDNTNNLFSQICRVWDSGISSMMEEMLATHRK